MQKTLGGDRLGSGSKMKVRLKGYERSTHNLSYLWRSTMSAGTLVPYLSQIALPGDTWDIDLDADIMTHPTIGPLFGSYKVQLDIFQAPMRLYISTLHNNALGIGLNMSAVKFPTIEMQAIALEDYTVPDETFPLDNAQINPSSILSYLGLRGVGMNTTSEPVPRTFNALSILAYWDIYKNYYANKQEEIGAVIHTPALALIQTVDQVQILDYPYTGTPAVVPENPGLGNITVIAGSRILITYILPAAAPDPTQVMVLTTQHGEQSINSLCGGAFTDDGAGTITCYYNGTQWGTTNILQWRYFNAGDMNTGKPSIATFDLVNIDAMRAALLAHPITTAFEVGTGSTTGGDLPPYLWINEIANDVPNILSSQEGLGLKTYQSDLFNNWLQTEWIDGVGGINDITAIDTSGGSFEINTLILARKVYDMLNRIAVSGGTYDDWIDTVYDNADRYKRCESPMYMGGLIRELVFQEVISNSQSEEQPLGTLAGKGVLGSKRKGGSVTIKVDEPSYIIGIISLTPRVDYSQGNQWDLNLTSMDDLHKPALDEIGFQELITEQMAWFDTQWNPDGGTGWTQRSAGKQPAWLNYMTNVNVTRGNFAIPDNEMFMTLNRRYECDLTDPGQVRIADLTTYIDPSKFNFIFAETQLDAQNFWAQIAIDIVCRRKMSAKVMPNL